MLIVLEFHYQSQRLDKASNSGGATFGKRVNMKVIFEIPGGPNAMLVLDSENSGGAKAPLASPLIQALYRSLYQNELKVI